MVSRKPNNKRQGGEMTKKDYELIANAIKKARLWNWEIDQSHQNSDDRSQDYKDGIEQGILDVTSHIAKALHEQNLRFDFDKFWKATSIKD